MRIQPTFTARHFADKSVVLICRETGTRYSFTEAHPLDSVPIFRDGSVMAYRRGKASALGCIESDARWQIREEQREEQRAINADRQHWHPTDAAVWL